MNTVDDRIRQALRAEDDELLKDLNEPGVLAQTLTTMRVAPRWTIAFVFVWTLAFMVAAVWFAVKFFSAEEIQHMIAWATGFIGAMLMVMALKLWFWMQMDKYVMLREVKRLELQVARLVERLGP
jgi:hypothetical protein